MTRLLCKIVFRSLLSNLFRILDMECFDRKKTKYDQSIRLYSPSFKLPPVFDKQVQIDFWDYKCVMILKMGDIFLCQSTSTISVKVNVVIFSS